MHFGCYDAAKACTCTLDSIRGDMASLLTIISLTSSSLAHSRSIPCDFAQAEEIWYAIFCIKLPICYSFLLTKFFHLVSFCLTFLACLCTTLTLTKLPIHVLLATTAMLTKVCSSHDRLYERLNDPSALLQQTRPDAR